MEDFVRTKTHLSTTENLSTTDTQHTLTTVISSLITSVRQCKVKQLGTEKPF